MIHGQGAGDITISHRVPSSIDAVQAHPNVQDLSIKMTKLSNKARLINHINQDGDRTVQPTRKDLTITQSHHGRI